MFLQAQSQKPSSAMTKLALMRTTTGMEDPDPFGGMRRGWTDDLCMCTDRRAKEKQPASAQHMCELLPRLLEKHSRWSWLRECQECSELSLRQRVATWKNLKYKIYFDLFNTFLVTTWFHMCYFIVVMSSLLFYNAENSKKKEKPWNE